MGIKVDYQIICPIYLLAIVIFGGVVVGLVIGVFSVVAIENFNIYDEFFDSYLV